METITVPASIPERADNGEGEHEGCGFPLVRATLNGELERPVCVECDATFVLAVA